MADHKDKRLKLRKILGNDVVSFLEKSQADIDPIIPCGAYLLRESNGKLLRDCEKIINDSGPPAGQRRRYKRIFEKLAQNTDINEAHETNSLEKNRLSQTKLSQKADTSIIRGINGVDTDSPPSKKRRLERSSDNGVHSNDAATTDKKTIGKPKHTRSTLPPDYESSELKKIRFGRFDENHIFNKCSTGEEMVHCIYGRFNTLFKPIYPALSKIFDEFQKRHHRFKYQMIVNNIPQDKNKLPGQLSIKQLQKFFGTVFFAVIPAELFGNTMNGKRLKKMIGEFFMAKMFDKIAVHQAIRVINIDKIAWLNTLAIHLRWIVIGKMIKWFFNDYILVIVGTYFRYEKSLYNEEKHIFKQRNWRKQVRRYMQQKIKDGVYVKISTEELQSIDSNFISEVRLHCYIKNNGVRPIVSVKNTDEEKLIIKMVNTLLYQLTLKYIEKFTLYNLYEIWSPLAKTYKASSSDKVLYFVTCDVQDAYGSIVHEKLLKLVFDMIDQLSTPVISHPFRVLKSRADYCKVIIKECIVSDNLPLALPSKSLCSRIAYSHKESIDKNKIKQTIEAYVTRLKVKIMGDYYCQKIGLSQGIGFMAHLSNLYYDNMVSEVFGEFKKSGRLLRYVDDFLYLTDNKASAEKFLALIERGIPEYNCTFSPSKIHTNLAPYNEDEFVYLGFKFNINTFDVAPRYAGPLTVYTMATSKAENVKGSIKSFIRRLTNITHLKLNKLILSPVINSRTSILANMKTLIKLSAVKCAIITSKMFEKVQDCQYLFPIIEDVSVNFLKKRLFESSFNDNEMIISEAELNLMIWTGYWEVFKRNTFMSHRFGKMLKKRINLLRK